MRILVAGLGNVFFGDDGFGVEVVARMARRSLPDGVVAVDFGIRGLDLAYALGDGYAAAILVDAARRGHPPGTLSVIETSPGTDNFAPFGHAVTPAAVLALSRTLGAEPCPVRIVACEPASLGEEGEWVGLSATVAAAVEPAIDLTLAVVGALRGGHHA